MKRFNLAIVGATGAVGREILRVLEERNFPVNKLKLLATTRSVGTALTFRGEKISVKAVSKGIFKDVDIALFSAGSGPGREIAPWAVSAGAIVIDNSNAFRMEEKVPLVVPEVNPEDLNWHQGIIANPNCSTIQLVVVLKPIYDQLGIKRIVISTYQAVSGSGQKAITELRKQSEDYLKGKEVKAEVYPHQIAFNALPQIDIFEANAYTREEMKIVRETQKILHDANILISPTAVRIPVFYGHSEAVNVETKRKIELPKLKKILRQAPGVKLIDDPAHGEYPLAIMSETDDHVLVGRIRKDLSNENAFNLWIVANNLRKGAALNAVQIAELLIKFQL